MSFTNASLIDEYRILVHPVILGNGKPLFANIKNRHSLKLADIKRYSGGAVLFHYRISTYPSVP